MKKLLAGLFIFGFLAIGAQAHASVLSDALLKITSLQSELSQLKTKLGALAIDGDVSAVAPVAPPAVSPITVTSDLTPRISYWSGKVNQHVDVDAGEWVTDPDGSSGAGIDQLTYCKKWYPNTTSVVSYQNENINAWHGAGNVGDYASTKMSYQCVQGTVPAPVATPSITVLSPNGGETYTAGQQITVKWNSNNLSKTTPVQILLVANFTSGSWNSSPVANFILSNDNSVLNSGSATFTLPVQGSKGWTGSSSDLKFGNYYKIYVSQNLSDTINASDYSDNTFTINSPIVDPGDNPTGCPIGSTSCTTDTTDRISMWSGKVNQHVVAGDTYTWQTDVDGVSGANLDKLTYCKKFYPNTTSVTEYKNETINSWRAAGNTGNYSGTKMSYQCVQGSTITIPSLKVSLDSTSPVNQTISAGSGNVTFAKIKITAGSQDVNNLNAIQIASDLPNSTKLNNILVYDGSTQIGGTNNGLTYNGSYYQSWVYLDKKLSIPANTSKIISVVADISPVGSISAFSGNVRLGVAGWTFDYPGATVSPSGTIYGSTFIITSSTVNACSLSATVVDKYLSTDKTGWGFHVIVNANNEPVNSNGWIANFEGYTPSITAYGINKIYGNFFLSSGPLSLTAIDQADSNCSVTTTITPPTTDNGCSNGQVYSSTTGQICPDTPNSCPNGATNYPTCTITPDVAPSTQTLKVGVKGDDVAALQTFLGITADGSFGPITKAKVMEWQASNGLTADGSFGPISRQKAGL